MWRAVVLAMLLAGPALADGPDGRWRLVELDGSTIEPADQVTLVLAEGHVSGRSGCKRFVGAYRLDSGFSFGPLAMTRMMCQGRAAQIETRFSAAVTRVSDWRLNVDVLELLEGDRPILRAVPEPRP